MNTEQTAFAQENQKTEWLQTRYDTTSNASVHLMDRYLEQFTLYPSRDMIYRRLYWFFFMTGNDAGLEFHFFLNNQIVLKLPISETSAPSGATERWGAYSHDFGGSADTLPIQDVLLFKGSSFERSDHAFRVMARADMVKVWIPLVYWSFGFARPFFAWAILSSFQPNVFH